MSTLKQKYTLTFKLKMIKVSAWLISEMYMWLCLYYSAALYLWFVVKLVSLIDF